MSAYHFIRSFRTVVGMPPHAYQLHVRIARAKTLLRQGSSIAQTAFATGFADQSHLTNRFKAVLGITPGQYRSSTTQFHSGSRNLQDAAPGSGP